MTRKNLKRKGKNREKKRIYNEKGNIEKEMRKYRKWHRTRD
jgi:hypothetical protein